MRASASQVGEAAGHAKPSAVPATACRTAADRTFHSLHGCSYTFHVFFHCFHEFSNTHHRISFLTFRHFSPILIVDDVHVSFF